MNDEPVALRLIVAQFYVHDPNGRLLLKDLVAGPFRLFLFGLPEKARKIKIKAVFEEVFGPEVHTEGRYRQVCLKVAEKFHLSEAEHIVPMDSPFFNQISRLQHFLTGSKVAFTRRCPISGLPFLHTGIFLRGNLVPDSLIILEDGLPMNPEVGSCLQILEVKVVSLRSGHENILDRLLDLQMGFNRDDLASYRIQVLNDSLGGMGVDMAKVLYRFGRVAELPVQFHPTLFNSDIFATWLQVGIPIWTAKSPEAARMHEVVRDQPPRDGAVSLNLLNALERNHTGLQE